MDKEQLKAAGLKITTPRLQILELLASSDSMHLSAEDVYNRLKESGVDMSLATIYRALSQFEVAGLVIRHHFEGDHSVYELDGGEHHDHLVCTKCRKVVEFHDEVIEERQQQVASEHGFLMGDHCLNIYGVCRGCQDS